MTPAVNLVLPYPPDELSPNARPNRYAKARAIASYRLDCFSSVWEQLGHRSTRSPLTPPVTARVEFVVTVERNRDEDNAGASLKPMWDGLVDARVLTGDHAKVLHIERPTFVKGLKREVHVHLEAYREAHRDDIAEKKRAYREGLVSGRRELDFYPTPAWMTDHLLDRLDLRHNEPHPPRIVEPCVGQGHIVNAIKRRYPAAQFITNDLDHQWPADCHMDAGDRFFHGFGTPSFEWDAPDWVISNPPFSEAFDIVRNALEVARIGVAMLLRVTWLEPPKEKAKARGIWLAEHPPAWELVMERFSFDGSGKQDSAPTAWFVWSKYLPPRIEVIPGRGRQPQLLKTRAS